MQYGKNELGYWAHNPQPTKVHPGLGAYLHKDGTWKFWAGYFDNEEELKKVLGSSPPPALVCTLPGCKCSQGS